MPSNSSAWLPTDVSPQEAEALIDDNAWFMQEKKDGHHVQIHRMDNLVLATNRDGAPREVPQEIKDAFLAVEPYSIFDGELLHRGPFVPYDLLSYGNVDCRQAEARTRLTILETIYDQRLAGQPYIQLISTAYTATEKIAMLERLRLERAEGVIFKWAEAPYTPGRPVTGGTMRRWKFKKRCEVIVQRRINDLKRSFEMYVYTGEGEITPVGSVSARSFYERLKPGAAAVAEIEYLYATPGNRLYQPVLVDFRDDKDARECGLGQLVVGKRFTIAS